MYSVGLTPDRDEEKSELFGNLSLVGSGGRFVAVLTKRQLTLERFDGHGIRLSLASISRMRHMKVPLFPSGTVPLGLLAIYLGTSVLMPPYAMVAMAGGSLTLLGYVLSRTSVLAVETEAGDRHIISGSEGVLLRLCLMVDRVRHGSTIEEARMGLEHIDAELPAYPAFTDAGGGLPEPKGLLELPEEESFLATVPEPESHFTGFSAPPPPSTTAPAAASTEPIFPWESEVVAADTVPTYEPPSVPQEEARSAYERAWGREEAPQWYEEKPAGSRIDSALGEAAVGMDLFGEGGIFDAEPPASYSPPTPPPPTPSPPAPATGFGRYIHGETAYQLPNDKAGSGQVRRDRPLHGAKSAGPHRFGDTRGVPAGRRQAGTCEAGAAGEWGVVPVGTRCLESGGVSRTFQNRHFDEFGQSQGA